MGDTWYLDELFVTIRGQRQDLWRAVDQDGDVIDILVQRRRDRHVAARFFRKLLKRQGRGPLRLVNLFRVGRHLLRAVHHRLLRARAFGVRQEATCVQIGGMSDRRIGGHSLSAQRQLDSAQTAALVIAFVR